MFGAAGLAMWLGERNEGRALEEIAPPLSSAADYPPRGGQTG